MRGEVALVGISIRGTTRQLPYRRRCGSWPERGFYNEEAGAKGLPPLSPAPPIPADPPPLCSGQFRLTIANTYSTITMPASLRSDCCSPSLRNVVRLPSGIDVHLHRNTQFRTTSSITAYRDQEEGYAADPHPLPKGAIIWAADKSEETRTLNGRAIRVVLFTVGGSGIWYWIPREQFERLTEKRQLSDR